MTTRARDVWIRSSRKARQETCALVRDQTTGGKADGNVLDDVATEICLTEDPAAEDCPLLG